MSAEPAWYIDALDVRAGRAVATLREETLLQPDAVFDTGPSIFVGPPLFVPEFLRSRATGFGLARGRAQIGLFLTEKAEVPFPTINAVAEFVRRTYLRGSSGDGPGESGGAPPRAPEGGTDPTGLEPIHAADESDPVKSMIAFATSCDQHSRFCSLGEAKPPGSLAHQPPPHASDRLLRGARRISLELLGRVRSGDAIEWSISAQRLIAVLCRLGITRHFRPLPPLWDIAPEDVSGRPPPVEYLFSVLTGEHLDPFYRRGSISSGLCAAGVPAADPFEDLAFLPVPTYGSLNAPDNVQALLSAFVATPAATLDPMPTPDPRRSEASAELVLFAACYITLGTDRSLGIYANNDPAWAVMADRLVTRALGWLADNVPKLVFEARVEGLIVGASSVPA